MAAAGGRGLLFFLSGVNDKWLWQLFREQGNLAYRAGDRALEEDISVLPKISFFPAIHEEIQWKLENCI